MSYVGQDALQALYSTARGDVEEDSSGVGGDETVSESLSKEVFSTYVCSSIDRGLTHPGDIAESTGLSAIPLPASTYPLWDSIPESIITSGKLSKLQLEGVLYACTKHLEWLPSGERAGFFIGDGAGVGKGRQVAGIVLDNYARGRRRHIWLSTSTDLHHDAERDLRDLGCHLGVINNCQTLDRETRVVGLPKDLQEGILFMTYTTLISSVKSTRRLQQVIDWVGGTAFDGCLVFDECHKAKNFVPGKEAQSTKVAAAVLDLQRLLPRARVVYCSATGVSEVGNMAYMSRLGLWGPGSAFPDFEAFLDSMKKRGMSFMEMLAMEMKAEGFYVARGLSFRTAEFLEMECRLSTQQVAVYDAAVGLWQELRQQLGAALQATNATNRDVWKPFWAAQQRFFKLLCVSLKVLTVVAEAKAALEAGHAVVIGLQATGEAAADALGLEPGQVCGFVSTTRELLSRFVSVHFPTRLEPSGREPKAPGEGEDVEECVEAKEQLLAQIAALELPPNFLDDLIDQLGGPKAVAEMTGRRGRIVRDARGRGVYQLRAKSDSSEMDSLNVKETSTFMSGQKLIAIVSDAASTGISLHASMQCKNQRRRVHLTIELPWSADKAIQQLGRSHRSNQASAPIYKLVSTNVGGEKRFAAAVARRLQSLGALTRGDRRAGAGIDLSESNFDSPIGRKSLRKMYDCIIQGAPQLPKGVELLQVLDGILQDELTELVSFPLDGPPGSVSAAQLVESICRLHERMRDCVHLMGVGLEAPKTDTVTEDAAALAAGGTSVAAAAKDLGDVKRFLNRLLGLPVARQNLLFNYFAATMSADIRAARKEGRYTEGVLELGGSSISKSGQPQTLWVDQHSGLNTIRNDLTIDRGLSFEAAVARLEQERVAGDASGFRRSRRDMYGRPMVLLALQKPGQRNTFAICRPNTGASYFDMEVDELNRMYVKASPQEAEGPWAQVYESTLVDCMHGPNCKIGPECNVGRRQAEVTVLSGSVVRIWGALERVLTKHEHSLSRSDRTMKVVRVEFGDATSLVGVRYPQHLLAEVIGLLTALENVVPAQQGQQGVAALPGAAAQQQALDASALGARSAATTEAPTPVDKKALAKALRPPRNLMDFFKPKAAPQLPSKVEAAPQPSPGSAPPSPALQSHSPMQPKRVTAQQPAASTPAAATQLELPHRSPHMTQPSSSRPSRPASQRVQHKSEVIELSEDTGADVGCAEADAEHRSTANGAAAGTSGSAELRSAAMHANGSHHGAMSPLHPLQNLIHSTPNATARKPQEQLRSSGIKCFMGAAAGSGGGPNKRPKVATGISNDCAEPSACAIEPLLAMGFGREQVLRAWRATQGNVSRAADWLLLHS